MAGHAPEHSAERGQPGTDAGVDLLWIPLGAGPGGGLVRWSGRLYEAVLAVATRRRRAALYHSALAVHVDGVTTTVEMAPVWTGSGDRGVVAQGPVGARLLGRNRLFRYELRCWAGGVIPDADDAVGGPERVSGDPAVARAVVALAPTCPTLTWGRDELGAGEMWNSNSIVSWLLYRAGIDVAGLQPPSGGRAPGWLAGLVAARSTASPGSP